MALPKDAIDDFPHIRFRSIEGHDEPYVLDTGLAVWEIAMLACGWGEDADIIGRETYSNAELIAEGLRYAAAHRDEMDEQISRHTVNSVEELRARFPEVPILVLGDYPKESTS